MKKQNETIKNIQLWMILGGCLVLMICFFIGIYEHVTDNQFEIFFRQCEDYMADFFNVLVYADNLNSYTNPINDMCEKAYLPLSYIIFFVFRKCMKFDGYDGSLESINPLELTVTGFIIAAMMAVICVQFYDMIEERKVYKFLIMLAFLFSGVNLFSYERGNIVLLAVICMVFFLNTYESESRILRELGYISLAIAAALKGYPAILGLLLLYRKEYWQAIRLFIYGILIAIGPFGLMEGGFSNIPIWWGNLKQNSAYYGFQANPKIGYYYFIAYAQNATIEKQEAWKTLWQPIIIGVSVLGIITSTFQTRRWIQVGMLISITLMLPSNCGLYCLLYMLPVIILYLNEQKKRWVDLIYLPLFICMLNPYQFINQITGRNMTLYWINIALLVFFGLLVAENIWSIIQVVKERKQKNGNQCNATGI